MELSGSPVFGKVTEQFVEMLKKEMLENRTCDVAPMIGLVFLLDGEQFDHQHPEGQSMRSLGETTHERHYRS
jgi:hypothetical protein